MAPDKIRGKDLIKIGYPQDTSITIALDVISKHFKKRTKDYILNVLNDVRKHPQNYKEDFILGKIAEQFLGTKRIELTALNPNRAPYSIFGEEHIGEEAKNQLYTALKLPITYKGALMPDAHSGYGLPIGGVLATHNAVIPYGVGVDIGCRMCMTIYDIPTSYLDGHKDKYKKILQEHTKFGMYETHKQKQDHEIFERSEFREIPMVKSLKDKAYQQLGTSGGGNHFVEFGTVTISSKDSDLGLAEGSYLAILSHSGSRALGANLAMHYTRLATKQCPLPKEAQHLAWLDLTTHDGLEYWLAMNLAGDYAKACHDNLHQRLAKLIGGRPLVKIENHHNFAWKEWIDDQEVIVHRKGATPAQEGVLGIIPGSMTDSGFIVKGKGNISALNSASHGSGRVLSRGTAKSTLTQGQLNKKLLQEGVTLIGGGIDEAPMVYKDIHQVMAQQTDLVEVLGVFQPKIVRMDASKGLNDPSND
jgi:tRNA-splicing ligase RtcB